ncbi:hypothetical protein [Pseudoalteromonas luteoviolacea]|uniref:hypothetical protein n=1 Tax=Pseudoalteromonas luteoviolacea TaxID=43657 RepID=UPI00186BA7C8|nr:hypothetical protein [Pseudoalteromonas luteoviolacea]MBE0389869.1 hypothetical protein [Pseudoalteromonas luteoviolacea DSM 6061]
MKGGAILIDDNDDIYIVLTPHCDLANNKAEFIQIAKVENIFNLERVQKAVSKHKINNSNSSKKSVETSLGNMVKNKLSRYHYLPKSGPVNVPSVIDFQKLKSVEQNKFSDGYRVVGTVAESFYKDILNRFSINYSRQGSPDYDFENELESLLAQATR